MSYKQEVLTFAQAAAIRAIRTFAQVALTAIGSNTFQITQIDWVGVLSLAAGSALVSVLTSIYTGLPEVDPNDDKAIGRHLKGGANGAQ